MKRCIFNLRILFGNCCFAWDFGTDTHVNLYLWGKKIVVEKKRLLFIVCVSERERERERDKEIEKVRETVCDREREREGEREREIGLGC